MDLSIIIVEYLDYLILDEAIQSAFAHIKDLTVEIIVISNSSYSQVKQVTICSEFPNDLKFFIIISFISI